MGFGNLEMFFLGYIKNLRFLGSFGICFCIIFTGILSRLSLKVVILVMCCCSSFLLVYIFLVGMKLYKLVFFFMIGWIFFFIFLSLLLILLFLFIFEWEGFFGKFIKFFNGNEFCLVIVCWFFFFKYFVRVSFVFFIVL